MAEIRVLSELNGSVWKIEVAPGDCVAEGDTLILLESMKMEIPVAAPKAGTVKAILVQPEQSVAEDELLVVLDDA